jgi:hypothetical protein
MTPVCRIIAVLAAMSFLAAADPILPVDLAAFGFNGGKDFGRREQVAVVGQSFPQAWRITVSAKPEQEWVVNSLCDIDRPLAGGDVLVLSFWMRAERQAGVAPSVRVQHQRASAPFVTSLNHVFHPTADWVEYRVAYKVAADYVAKETRIAFFFGAAAPQTVELAQVACVNHGQVDTATLGLPVWVPPGGR